jgi:hypothetical protein
MSNKVPTPGGGVERNFPLGSWLSAETSRPFTAPTWGTGRIGV